MRTKADRVVFVGLGWLDAYLPSQGCSQVLDILDRRVESIMSYTLPAQHITPPAPMPLTSASAAAASSMTLGARASLISRSSTTP